MSRATWRTFIRPLLISPIVVMGTVALLSFAAAQLAVAAPLLGSTLAADCSSAGFAASAVARHSGAAPVISQRIDGTGTYAGLTLTVAASPGALSLPVESFVGEPVGDALVYTTSVSGKSEVHVMDLATGCDAVIARPAGTVRSAILDPDGSSVYVHSVGYPVRADAGVTKYTLDGSPAQPALPPIADDASFGVTFGTQLGWSTDAADLSVQSCGIQSCRTRLLDIVSGAVSTFDQAGQGQIVGVTPTHLITFAACDGLPCPVLSTDRQNNLVTDISDEAWAATLDGNDVHISTQAGALEIGQ